MPTTLYQQAKVGSADVAYERTDRNPIENGWNMYNTVYLSQFFRFSNWECVNPKKSS
jgi:hypothetical protein